MLAKESKPRRMPGHGDGLSYFSVGVSPSPTPGHQEYWDRTVKNTDVFAEEPRFTLLQLSAHVLCHAGLSLRGGPAIKTSFAALPPCISS